MPYLNEHRIPYLHSPWRGALARHDGIVIIAVTLLIMIHFNICTMDPRVISM